MKEHEQKFELGRTMATRGVREEMERNFSFGSFVMRSLVRHATGDWGDLDPEDAKLNDAALTSGEDRIFSVYKRDGIPDGKIWIITERDRSATTVLFPSEY